MSPKNIAAVLEAKHGQIITAERPIPTPGPGEILVRNKAVAGNPVEWMVRDFGFAIKKYPTVLGSDVAGTIEAIGPEVTKFRIGERVVGYASVLYTSNPDHGAWQTFTILKQSNTTPLPASISFEEGCIFPMALATTINAFFVQMALPRPANASTTVRISGGDGLLIWGGGGAVGAIMIQLGKALGFTVFSTASPKHYDRLRKLGVNECFDYRDPEVVQKIIDSADAAETKISHAIDTTSSRATLSATADVLYRSGGPSSKVVTLSDWPEDLPCPIQKFQTVAYTTFLEHMDLVEWFFNNYLAEALEKGVIVSAPPIEIIAGGVASSAAVLDKIKSGISGIKLVVQVD